MTKLNPLPPEKVVKFLRHIGFENIRQKGSHLFMRHQDGRTTVVPIHKGEEIGKGMLRKIIKDCELTNEEFLRILEEIK